MLGAVEPASTLMIVAGLATPELLIEVEGIAARPAPGGISGGTP
jgi:enamine deaminase RidA (YjgF/YER057c/UK114 family)